MAATLNGKRVDFTLTEWAVGYEDGDVHLCDDEAEARHMIDFARSLGAKRKLLTRKVYVMPFKVVKGAAPLRPERD